MLTPIDPRTGRRRIQILPDDFGETTAHGMRESDFHISTGLGDPSADEMLRDAAGIGGQVPTRRRGLNGIAGILLNDTPEEEAIGSPETDPVTLDRGAEDSPLPALGRPQLDGERVGRARRTAGLAGLAGLLDVALNGGDSGLAAVAGGVMRGAQGIEAREQGRFADELETYADLEGARLERQERMAVQKELRRMQEEGDTERTRIEEAGRMEREMASIEMDKVEEDGRMQRDAVQEARMAFQFAVDQGSEDAAVQAAELAGIDTEQARSMARRVREEEDAEQKLKLRREARQWFQAQTGRINATRPRASGGRLSGSRSSSGTDDTSTLGYIEDMAELYGKDHPAVESLRRNYLSRNDLNTEEYEATLTGARNAIANGHPDDAADYIDARVADGSISEEQARGIARTLAGG
ncbi:MAG: hypothetical protein Rubg2KO_15540 [Rubricoccaceae bacterium]